MFSKPCLFKVCPSTVSYMHQNEYNATDSWVKCINGFWCIYQTLYYLYLISGLGHDFSYVIYCNCFDAYLPSIVKDRNVSLEYSSNHTLHHVCRIALSILFCWKFVNMLQNVLNNQSD